MMENIKVVTLAELEAGLELIRQSPSDVGELKLIVRRPGIDEREILDEAMLNPVTGLVGDTWVSRGSSRTADGAAHPDAQLTLMNTRVISLMAVTQEEWALAGDQLYVDLDLSAANLPPGTQLEIGAAVIEVTDLPHTGCKKFAARFGHEALKFISAPARKEMQLRGIHTRIVRAGRIRAGDLIKKRQP
jgi:MOSC domain-containing protein YiiM